MAKQEVAQTGPSTVGYADTGFEWTTVHHEAGTQITFDEIGDTFIGIYTGMDTVNFVDRDGEEKSFTQINWRVGDESFVTNAGYDLVVAYKDVPANSMTRTQLLKLVDVNQASPMKSYRVDVAPAAPAGDDD